MIPQAVSKLITALAAFIPLPEQVAAFAMGVMVGIMIARRLDAKALKQAEEALGKAVSRKVTPNRVPKKR